MGTLRRGKTRQNERLESAGIVGNATLPAGCPPVESAGCADLGVRAKRQPIGGASSPMCPHDAQCIIHRAGCARNVRPFVPRHFVM
jgi:hypothetical protein